MSMCRFPVLKHLDICTLTKFELPGTAAAAAALGLADGWSARPSKRCRSWLVFVGAFYTCWLLLYVYTLRCCYTNVVECR